jgi:hypothetical protein
LVPIFLPIETAIQQAHRELDTIHQPDCITAAQDGELLF